MKKSGKKAGLLSARRQKATPEKKPSISIIGAGRLGTALGQALNEIGYRIEFVVAKHAAGARRAAKLAGRETLWLTSRQLERLKHSEYDRLSRIRLIIIATPDDVIALVARQLAALFKSIRPKPQRSNIGLADRRIAIHASGALSSEALLPLRSAGFVIASLHPLVSISDPLSGAELFRDAYFCVEGDPAAVRVARSIVRNLGGQSFTIEPSAKALYHAAAVTSSGHVVALFDIALEMLGRCGLSPRQARKVLLPLLESTLTNLSRNDPSHALTGTLARGDIAIVRRHLAAMESQNLSQALAAYRLLGQRSLSLARRGNRSKDKLDRIAKILAVRRRPGTERF
jgi:predicted short-subunit dehydrogenase-like oxidoreductase (DUF2520 family)